MRKVQRAVLGMIAACVLLTPLSVQAGPLRPVALTGTDGPLGPGMGTGVVFTSFTVSDLVALDSGWPSINGVGQTVFFGTVAGPGIDATNDRGIWVERNGSLELVARAGDPAPGTDPGITIARFFRQPVVSDTGAVAFMGLVQGPGVTNDNNDTLWTEGPGTLSLLIRENITPTPDGTGLFANPIGGGDPQPRTFPGQLRINRLGKVAVTAFTTQTPPSGLTATQGIYTDRNGPLEEIVRSGSSVPGLTPPRVFLGSSNFSLSDTGAITFESLTSLPFPQFTGIWAEQGGSLVTVAKSGDAAPGTAAQFASLFFNPGINSAERVAFMAFLTGGEGFDQGVWSEGTFGVVQPIAISGSVAPGTSGGIFFTFDPPVVGDDGTTAFVAGINRVIPNRGVWSNRTGLLQSVAVARQSVPDVPGASFVDFFSLGINATGHVSFFATTSTGKVLCVEGSTGTVETVAATFTPMDLFGDGSDVRLVTDIVTPIRAFSLDAIASATGDGRRMHFNDAGDLSFRVAFAGDSEAIMTTAPTQSPPCPADIDGDGDADVADFFAFVVAFAAGDPAADVNGDGSIDVGDFFAFIVAFAAGCP